MVGPVCGGGGHQLRRPLEAAAKCFVFFLVSQPLVYGVEILFGSLSLEMGLYYYRAIWLPATLLTLPGGFAAFFCKKQSVPGAVILGLGCAIEAMLGVWYAECAAGSFPHHLLSALFCAVCAVGLPLRLQKKPLCRAVALGIPLLAAVGTFFLV